MTRQSATIKVLCHKDAIQNTANMLQWAIGHPVKIADTHIDAKIGCLFIFTEIEYYENDTTLFENLGFDMIGKIHGVVSWEILSQDVEDKLVQGKEENVDETEIKKLEADLMRRLCTLPITISIMPRMEEKYAWKCLEASGQAETFGEALEEALTHLTYRFKIIRSELLG
jgi:hypothetical protein